MGSAIVIVTAAVMNAASISRFVKVCAGATDLYDCVREGNQNVRARQKAELNLNE